MIPDEDALAAYADGELGPARMAEVEAAAVADPEVARRLDAHKALRGRLASAYDPVLDEALPDSLIGAVMASAPAANDNRFGRWPAFAAMAACLVVGLAVGRTTLSGPLVADDMAARGALAQALESGLASQPGDKVRIGVSFASADGYCRSFQTADTAGLACRQGDGWTVQALAPYYSQSDDGYRLASSMPPALAAAIEARMTGDPLDAEAERAARDRGWTP